MLALIEQSCCGGGFTHAHVLKSRQVLETGVAGTASTPDPSSSSSDDDESGEGKQDDESDRDPVPLPLKSALKKPSAEPTTVKKVRFSLL